MPTDKTNTTHYQWGNACDSWIHLDSPSLSVKQELMPPGTKEKKHFHTIAQQFFFILKGEAAFYVDEETLKVKAGQGLSILPHCKHFIANEGNEDLEFLVISNPSTNNDRTEIL